MKPNDRQIDDIVAMLDRFMSHNGGHMDIRAEQDGAIVTETTTGALECGPRDMACAVPTLFEGLDGGDDINTEYDYKTATKPIIGGVYDDECEREPNR